MSRRNPMPSLLQPGRALRGKLTQSDRAAQWLEVTPGLYLRKNRITALRPLLRKHGCTAQVGAAAGYLGDPTLTISGPKHRYVMRLFTAEQLAVTPAWKKPKHA
jgi:hypothetical protein